MTKAQRLADLYKRLEEATPKISLANKPEDIVPGEGDPEAKVLFIGEAPGANEAEQRRPFVGRSGQLLRSTLNQIGLPPEKVYIANIVKARPPNNRDPSPKEIGAYKKYLDGEIEIIDPQLIVTLGRFSMGKFLDKVKITQVHGRLHQVQWKDKSLYILPMFHPAAGLRNPHTKVKFVEDMKKIPKIIDWIKDKKGNQTFEQEIRENLL